MGNCLSSKTSEQIYEDKRCNSQSGALHAIIVGVTGRGKSSIANALVQRSIVSDEENYFPIGAGGIRVTEKAAIGSGCGWQIVDTVGSSDRSTDGSREGAIQHIKDFIDQVCKIKLSFNYVIFVAKGNALDSADEAAWNMFREIFRGCFSNFVVVFTRTTQEWVDENMDDIKRFFHPCKLFIGVSLPKVSDNIDDINDKFIQKDNKIRFESINHLCNVLMNNSLKNGVCTPTIYTYSQKEKRELAASAINIGQDVLYDMGWKPDERRIINLGKNIEVIASNAIYKIVNHIF